jgi:hypothetical protein
MRLRTTKVFVDSRYAIGPGGSSILYEIPGGGVELGTNARCFVSEFTCVCAWPTIDQTALGDVAAGFVVQRTGAGSGSTQQQLLQVSHPSISFTLTGTSPLSQIVKFPPTSATSHVSGFVDLRRCHNIFVHSPSFGNYNTVAPGGVRTVLCKIPIETGYGGLVRWSTGGSSFDYIECSIRSLHLLRLELKDADGHLLDLQGTAFSMTLLFSDD